MKVAILISAFLVQAFAMSTTPPHHGHHGGHTAIHESFNFRYMEPTNTMLAIINHNCYMMKLEDAQKMDVMDAMKLHAIEGKMISAIDNNQYKAVQPDMHGDQHHDPHHHAPHMDLQHLCHHVYEISMTN